MWPTPQDYNEAIQNPRLCFADQELAASMPDTNALGLPRPISGSFASVYQMRGFGKRWAVRCFLRQFADQAERYKRISECLAAAKLPYTVPFEFIARGIKVGDAWYPILKMEWADGVSLTDWIHERVHQLPAMEQLDQAFRQMYAELQSHGIAHGDFQHGNILLVGNQVKLVDYDGMFVPALNGFASNELGHRHYQHPRRSSKHFAPYLDNFAAWSIYTSLHCLQHDSRLWQRLGAGDECLLFRQEDYEYPTESVAFRYLEHHDSRVIREASRTLRSLLNRSPDAIPALGEPIFDREHLPDLERPQLWFPSFANGGSSSTRAEAENLRHAYQTALATASAPPTLRVVDPDPNDPNAQMPWYQYGTSAAAGQQSNATTPVQQYQVPIPRRSRAPYITPLPLTPPPQKKVFGFIPQKYAAPLLTLACIGSIPLVTVLLVAIKGPVTVPVAGAPVTEFLPASSDGTNWYQEGRDLFAEGKYAKAADSFKVALEKASLADLPLCSYQIGRCEMKLGNYSTALSYFSRAQEGFTRWNRFIPTLYSDIGYSSLELKLYPEAVDAFSEQLRLCDAYSVPMSYKSEAIRGLRQTALAQLEAQHHSGFQTYHTFLSYYPQLLAAGASSQTQHEDAEYRIYSDFRDVAKRLEQKKKYDFAYEIWLAASDPKYLYRTSDKDRPQFSYRIQVLQAMIQNRKLCGHAQPNEVFGLEQRLKDLIDPNRPAKAILHDRQKLLEERYHQLQKQQYKM